MADFVSFTQAPSQRLHLDTHDDPDTMTVLLVLSEGDADWDRSNSKGDLQLPTLGFTLPLYPGDVVYFQSAVLPYRIVQLDTNDQKKRTIATCFTCSRSSPFFQNAMAELGATSPVDPIVKSEEGVSTNVPTGHANHGSSSGPEIDRPMKRKSRSPKIEQQHSYNDRPDIKPRIKEEELAG